MLRQVGLKIILGSLFLSLISFLPLTGQQGLANAKSELRQSWQSDISTLKPDDIPVPIPFSLRLPFPWSISQGTWSAKKGDFHSYFSFNIIQNRITQEKQFVVRQIDAVSCAVIARGMGTVKANSMSAKMRNLVDGRSYRLDLSSFPEAVLPKQISVSPIHGHAMILSITIACQDHQQTFDMGIQKMTHELDFNCDAQNDFGSPAF